MENFEETEQIEQEETLLPQPSPKRKYLLIGAIATLVVLIGGAGIFMLLIQKEAPSQLEITEPETLPADPITNWQIYRNEEFGFEMKYPLYLKEGETILQQPFNPGLEGSIVSTFSDGRANELIVSISQRSLDEYIVRDNPGGVYYRFDQETNRWVSSVRGEITGREPESLDTAVTAYGYRSGDIIWSWHGAVVPHPTENYILELVLVRNLDEEQRQIPDLEKIVDTIRFVEPIDTSDWQTYHNAEFGFEVKYPSHLSFTEEGPNFTQQQLERGETISGTIQPSLDTIVFANQENNTLSIEVFYPTEKSFLKSDYSDGYLYLRGPCDLRWGFEPSSIEEQNLSGHPALLVQGNSTNCGYLKSRTDNLIVVHSEDFNLLNQILSTFRFIEEINTSDWQTYRNEEFGYEVKYPSTLEILEFKPTGGSSQFVAVSSDNIGKGVAILVNTESVETVDIITWADQQKWQFSDDWRNHFTLPVIAGSQALQDSTTGSVILFTGKLKYYISNGLEPNPIPFEKNIFNQILSTFRFID